MSDCTVLTGDCRDILPTLPAESVNCVVTSPPYYLLRDYGVEGQIGLEPSIADYVRELVEVFREVWRVLRPDGTVWLNLGDGYNAYNGCAGKNSGRISANQSAARPHLLTGFGLQVKSLKPKDLMLMPHRAALALQEAGWWVRAEIVWAKRNPMPESIRDRPTRAHEFVFLLTRSERYWYDAEAVRTPARAPTQKMPDGWDTGPGAHGRIHREGREKGRRTDKQRGHGRRHAGFNARWDAMNRDEQCARGANMRDVWWSDGEEFSDVVDLGTQGFSGAHFATMPEALVELCILAGCPEAGVVLDPFLGSGTTLAVARRLNRRGVGIELNPEYVEIAQRRIGAVTLPLPLHGEETA